MSDPREVELKLAVAAADLARLRRRLRRFGRARVERIETVYHDTADFALAARGIALRVRRAGRRWLQTLKTEAGATALSRRGEWEMPAPRGRLDIARFAGTPLDALLRALPALQIGPRFRTRFTRTSWHTAKGAIEIALDEGEIVAGDRTEPILELELELKSGAAAALWQLALDLAGSGRSALALLPFGESKAARGVRLARGRMPEPAKANAKVFAAASSADAPVGAVLRSVIGIGAHLLLANAHGLASGDDPEFVHQARVAVRRMRAALRLFEGEVEFPPRLAAGLRWIGRELGRARDRDVFALQTLPALAPPAPLRAAAERQRARAVRRVRARLASARFAALALRLLQWSETPAGEGTQLRTFAPGALRRIDRRLKRAARGFGALPAAEQHRVRILAKRLRYAVDALACAFPQRATASVSARLAALQDILGEMNDIVVARELLATLAPESGAVRELHAGLARQHAALARQGEAALATLARHPAPW